MELTDEQLQMIEANNGEVPPELASILLNGYGETGTPSPESSAPDTAQVSDNQPVDAGEPNIEQTPAQAANAAPPTAGADPTADNAVVMAKDGKHTIPFERLTEARESAQQWKQTAELVEQHLAEFQQKMTEQASQPQTQQNQAAAEAAIAASGNSAEVMALFGDFSEEAIAKGVEQRK